VHHGPSLVARDLHVDRPAGDGDLAVLRGLSLDLDGGELVALVGPSGCGKSTLLDAMAGLIAPRRGEILLDGHAGGRLGRITLMPQRDALLPWRTVEENVALGAELGGDGRAAAARAARAAIARCGLRGFERHFPHALSGGMRQRAALARTLVARGRCWLLDEPFGALDAITRATLHAHLQAVWMRDRPTVLLVTHDLDEAIVLADRVAVCTPRPARVTAEFAVDLERPRGPQTTVEPGFAAIKRRLLEAMATAGALA
jgi:ABC-type nitrate/sulfonate/bicarbonate transport system ATPase subunit